MNRDGAVALTVFGAEGASHLAVIDRIVEGVTGTGYQFMPDEAFADLLVTNTSAGMRVYFSEILYRAHWAASTAVIRSQLWSSGVLQAFEQGNVLVLAACFRGLLESSADTNDALSGVAEALAESHGIVEAALRGQLTSIVVSPDLEDRLIHFTHARKPKPGEPMQPVWRAKTAAGYLEKLAREELQITPFYSRLCELVHAGSSSVFSFTERKGPGEAEIAPRAGIATIGELCRDSRTVMPLIMAAGVTRSLLVFKTLNRLPLAEVHTPFAEDIDLSRMPAWQLITAAFSRETRHPALQRPT